MKIKKCPYCGRKITYSSAFASRQRGEYVCQRCGKESKVIVDKKIIMVYIAFLLVAVVIMACWIMLGNISNPLGILLVALPFIIFTFISTKFLKFEPLKKYKKSMEARKAGKEYTDNLSSVELDSVGSNGYYNSDSSNGFKINSDVFNKIKAERMAARERLSDDSNISSSSTVVIDKKPEEYVPVKANVSQEHSNDDTPLKKIHSDREYAEKKVRSNYTTENKTTNYQKSVDRNKDNRYTANRKF